MVTNMVSIAIPNISIKHGNKHLKNRRGNGLLVGAEGEER